MSKSYRLSVLSSKPTPADQAHVGSSTKALSSTRVSVRMLLLQVQERQGWKRPLTVLVEAAKIKAKHGANERPTWGWC
jgi:hypothetical protein